MTRIFHTTSELQRRVFFKKKKQNSYLDTQTDSMCLKNIIINSPLQIHAHTVKWWKQKESWYTEIKHPQKKEHQKKPRTFLTNTTCTRGRNFNMWHPWMKHICYGCSRAKAGGTWGCAGQVSRDKSPGAENAAELLAALWRTWPASCSSCTLSAQPLT